MGSLIAFTCTDCVYAEEVAVGAGFSAVVYEVMVCDGCRRLGAVAVEAPPASLSQVADGEVRLGVCSRCGGDLVRHLHMGVGFGVAEPIIGAEPCPRCRRGALAVRVVGIWD